MPGANCGSPILVPGSRPWIMKTAGGMALQGGGGPVSCPMDVDRR